MGRGTCRTGANALMVEHHSAQGWAPCSVCVWKLPIGHSASCARGRGHMSCGCCPYRASCQSGGAPALRPGAITQSPGREAALTWASLAQRFPYPVKLKSNLV